MNDYIPITEAETDPEAPSTSSLWKRWTKNPLAMFAGAAGAPRLQAAALQAGPEMVQFVKSNVERADLQGFLTHSLGQFRPGFIGSYAFLSGTTNTQFVVGQVVSGSSLAWSGETRDFYQWNNDSGAISNTPLSSPVVGFGTWICMGNAQLNSNQQWMLSSASRFATLFLRIA